MIHLLLIVIDTYIYCAKHKLMAIGNYEVYVIGYNERGELGLNHKNNISYLTKCNISSTNICYINNGDRYSIFRDDINGSYYVCGANSYGQLGVNNNNFCITNICLNHYFTDKHIEIHDIFTNNCGSTTFWMDTVNRIYGHGYNNKYQLGVKDRDNRNKPILIKYLSNVLDIQCGKFYNIALCVDINPGVMIKFCRNWCGLNNAKNTQIPNDIINLIVKFYGDLKYNVYSTGFSNDYGHGHDTETIKKWKKIKFFNDNDIQIVNIKTGAYHTLFLDINGIIWSCGDNYFGQLGIGHFETDLIKQPTKIKYFIDNQIKIKHIECGWYHNLAIDDNNNLYSWGCNQNGQIGDGTLDNLHTPKLIKIYNGYNVKQINCGHSHSYVMLDNQQHFLFGNNQNNQCIIDNKNNNNKYIKIPYCINDIVYKQTNGKIIYKVFVGFDNTKLILYHHHHRKQI